MVRYIIKKTKLQGGNKGRVTYFGKGGREVDMRHQVKACETYVSRASANRRRRTYELYCGQDGDNRYEVVPVEVGTMIEGGIENGMDQR